MIASLYQYGWLSNAMTDAFLVRAISPPWTGLAPTGSNQSPAPSAAAYECGRCAPANFPDLAPRNCVLHATSNARPTIDREPDKAAATALPRPRAAGRSSRIAHD